MRVSTASIQERKSWAREVSGRAPIRKGLIVLGHFRSWEDFKEAVIQEIGDDDIYDLRTLKFHDEVTVHSSQLFKGAVIEMPYLEEEILHVEEPFADEPVEKTVERIQKWGRKYAK